MSAALLVVAAVLAVLLGIFVYALMKMADDCDRAAQYAEKRFSPYADVTVTQSGGS